MICISKKLRILLKLLKSLYRIQKNRKMVFHLSTWFLSCIYERIFQYVRSSPLDAITFFIHAKESFFTLFNVPFPSSSISTYTKPYLFFISPVPNETRSNGNVIKLSKNKNLEFYLATGKALFLMKYFFSYE